MIKIGVIGIRRGRSMIDFCRKTKMAQITAICDKKNIRLDAVKDELGDESVSYYNDFDEFLSHDMDAVILANYANEHAPFAIKAMKSGKHVLSEVLPCQTLKQAVELVECVEETGKIYAYAENYCYKNSVLKIKELYESGLIGKFEYGEGEYLHNCESIWPEITYGDENHWRNNMSAFYYCTHSLGPILHITKLRPVSVVGFELPFNERMARMGAKAGAFAVEIVTLENGTIIKNAYGVGPAVNNDWHSIHGANGRLESMREYPGTDVDMNKVMATTVNEKGEYQSSEHYLDGELAETAAGYGHGGGDFYMMYHFINKLNGDNNADVIDVYEALDMFLPGMFGYFSALEGGSVQKISNFRNPDEREIYRNDTRCTDKNAAGEQLLPSYSRGNPEIPALVYEKHKNEWEKHLLNK